MPAHLTWLQAGDPFPQAHRAWNSASSAPGLLAAGGSLDTATLCNAYRNGIFPWYSANQPVLWWSPDPRMVLEVADFRLHRSLRRTLQQFRNSGSCELRIDSAFDNVIGHCASAARRQQAGTWIVPEMQAAYRALHRAGHAHSVETWIDGQLVGGLYCVAIGRAVFGESMFALRTDASKIALAGLVALCRAEQVRRIDCQQNTRHLASLGAHEVARAGFLEQLRVDTEAGPVRWHFDPLYWDLLDRSRAPT